MLGTDDGLLETGRLQLRVDRAFAGAGRAKSMGPWMSVPGQAGRAPGPHEVGPIRGVEGVPVVEELEPAETLPGQDVLHLVVEEAPAPVDLPPAVAFDVPGGADAGASFWGKPKSNAVEPMP